MNPGRFVWFKSDEKHWPGVIINAAEAGLPQPPKGNTSVYWFGDGRISSVPNWKTISFASWFKDIYKSQESEMGYTWKKGVLEAIIEYSDLDPLMPFEKAVNFALANYENPDYIGKTTVPYNVAMELAKRLMDIWIPKYTNKRRSIFLDYMKNKKNFKKICIACYTPNPVADHPVFDARLCRGCVKKFEYTLYYDASYPQSFCTICGNSYHNILCVRPECKFTYCSECLRNFLVGPVPSEWWCFGCMNKSNIIFRRQDFRKRMIEFTAPDVTYRKFPEVNLDQKNILILFFGKSELIPVLYPSEELLCVIAPAENSNAFETVKSMEFPYMRSFYIDYAMDPFMSMTDVDQRSLNAAAIERMRPVHVLFGGTSYMSWNVVDGVGDECNPQEKSFWEFIRIYYLLKTHNARKKKDLKFVFEINEEINRSFADVVTRFLEVSPYYVLCNPENTRYRFIWTNFEN